jgi:hypothetical protein
MITPSPVVRPRPPATPSLFPTGPPIAPVRVPFSARPRPRDGRGRATASEAGRAARGLGETVEWMSR